VKPIKMLGLAALAALMAMAFIGSSSAMANNGTALCKEDPLVEDVKEHLDLCAEAARVKHVHEETLEGAKGKLLSSVLNVECDALFLGDVLTAGWLATNPNPLVISGKFTYSNCNSGCTATEENGPSEIKVVKEGHELAKITGKGLVHLVCSGFINCRYTGEGLTGHGLGPLLSELETGDVFISEQTTAKESGTFCPSTAKLDLDFHPLEPVYIGS